MVRRALVDVRHRDSHVLRHSTVQHSLSLYMSTVVSVHPCHTLTCPDS